jgi:hypothetical protein
MCRVPGVCHAAVANLPLNGGVRTVSDREHHVPTTEQDHFFVGRPWNPEGEQT